MLEHKINLICEETESDDYLLYVSNTEWLNERLNRRDRWFAKAKPYHPNFRIQAASSGDEKEYKGTRVQPKPLHYYNLLNYLANHPKAVLAPSGLEADDAMCIEQWSRKDQQDTIICSRDKDLKQLPGYIYSWEVGKQLAFGPVLVEGVGWLEKVVKPPKVDAKGKKKYTPAKVIGVGPKFFYYQLLAGDTVDNIGGVQGIGPVKGYELLHAAKTERECYEIVAQQYKNQFNDNWKVKLRTMSNLLYMIREVNEDGTYNYWSPPMKEE